jgi:hypothetical protein
MAKVIVVVVVIVIMLMTCIATAAGPGKEKAAVVAAQKWLALIDADNYADSWNEAAGYFRAAVNQEKWEQSLQAVRTPLGKIISRKVKSKVYQTSVPGAPDGEYVIIQFQTSFQNKKSAIETVTPMLDKDGQWRLSGYFIK